jgi:hypothetical protein
MRDANDAIETNCKCVIEKIGREIVVQPEDDRSTSGAERAQHADRTRRRKYEDGVMSLAYESRGDVGHGLDLNSGDVPRLRAARRVEHNALLSEFRKGDRESNGRNGAGRRHSVKQHVSHSLTARQLEREVEQPTH